MRGNWQPKRLSQLSPRQRAFVSYYKVLKNARKAAIAAGYKPSYADNAYFLLHHPVIEAEIFAHVMDPEQIEDIKHSNIAVMLNLRTLELKRLEEAKVKGNEEEMNLKIDRVKDVTVKLANMLGQAAPIDKRRITNVSVQTTNNTLQVSSLEDIIKLSAKISDEFKSTRTYKETIIRDSTGS